MIKKKLENKNPNDLIRDVLFITLIATIFFFLVSRFGGYFSDTITKKSCTAINERYIEGNKPGDGICVKSTNKIDIKKK